MGESFQKFDVVDTQVHVFHDMSPEACLRAMDSLGIRSVLIDEAWDNHSPVPPFQTLENGAFRPLTDGARMASMQHPTRFKYLRRVTHLDTDLSTIVRQAAEDPHCLALRAWVQPSWTADFGSDKYRPVFTEGAKYDIPVFVFTDGRNDVLEQYVRDVPECRFILDHVGFVRDADSWEHVLGLAKYPNLSLKWCHEHSAFDAGDHPYPALQLELKRAVEAYGAERVMWASDLTTLAAHGLVWADTLVYVRDSDLLTADQKAWVLGRTARTVLRWPGTDEA